MGSAYNEAHNRHAHSSFKLAQIRTRRSSVANDTSQTRMCGACTDSASWTIALRARLAVPAERPTPSLDLVQTVLLARKGERSARTRPELCQAEHWADSTPARQLKWLNCITIQRPVISPTKHQMKIGKLKSSSDGKRQDSTSVATGKSCTIFLWYKYLAWSLNTYRKNLRYTVRKEKKGKLWNFTELGLWDSLCIFVTAWQWSLIIF